MLLINLNYATIVITFKSVVERTGTKVLRCLKYEGMREILRIYRRVETHKCVLVRCPRLLTIRVSARTCAVNTFLCARVPVAWDWTQRIYSGAFYGNTQFSAERSPMTFQEPCFAVPKVGCAKFSLRASLAPRVSLSENLSLSSAPLVREIRAIGRH